MPCLETMRVMRCDQPGQPLTPVTVPIPQPGPGQVLIQVTACGVCRTDLHVVDGELPEPRLPIIPGHEIVGRVVVLGQGVTALHLGQRVGVPWLGRTCGGCRYCQGGRENLCDAPGFTGYTLDGGYAQYSVALADYVLPLPDTTAGGLVDAHLAPLLCAGLIGFRAYNMVPKVKRLGIYGFGAAAHIICQVAVSDGCEVYAFTRRGDTAAQQLAFGLGAIWVGASGQAPPHLLDAAIIFAPAGFLLPVALKALAKGGTVVCAGIHMSPIPEFSYDLLWGERSLRSVANLTRADGVAFFERVATLPIGTEVTCFSLSAANQALDQLRNGKVTGAAVLIP